jgi:hypothetical protein
MSYIRRNVTVTTRLPGGRHRDAHGQGRAPNAWIRVGEKKEGEDDGGGAKVIIGGVIVGVAIVAVVVVVWMRAHKGGGWVAKEVTKEVVLAWRRSMMGCLGLLF